jgi:hypothetical protein
MRPRMSPLGRFVHFLTQHCHPLLVGYVDDSSASPDSSSVVSLGHQMDGDLSKALGSVQVLFYLHRCPWRVKVYRDVRLLM